MTDISPAFGDKLVPFQLESSVLRGRIIRLGGSIDEILRLHDYPEGVAKLLAEAAALAVILGSSMKFDGVFTLQAKSDGPVSMLVADVTSDGALRACAQFDADKVAAGGPLLGAGHMAFTVDQKIEDRYQGIVALHGDNLTEAFQLYFRQSEQIPTGLLVAAGRDATGHWQAGCLMIQRMPREGGVDAPSDTAVEDDWLRAMALMQTCTVAELIDPALPLEDLLYRLFHEEVVRVYEPRFFRHECRCSREKIGGVLASMDEAERRDLLVDGRVEVSCQFCSRTYTFTPEDLGLGETA